MRKGAALVFFLVCRPVSADAARTISRRFCVTVDGVTASGGTSARGPLRRATFPAISDTPLFKREIPKIAGTVVVTFDRLPPGTYAVKALRM
jgi:uncharacterized protein (DUF2141 family)